jgi:hypothetical protein
LKPVLANRPLAEVEPVARAPPKEWNWPSAMAEWKLEATVDRPPIPFVPAPDLALIPAEKAELLPDLSKE